MASILSTNKISRGLNRLYAELENKTDIHQAMAHGAEVLTSHHFAELANTQHNRFGKRSSFWQRMRRSLFVNSNQQEGRLLMGREVAQRYFGGTIKPTGGRKYLTIPESPDAYGKRATDVKGLVFVRQTAGEQTVALLVKPSKKGVLGEIYYRLVKQVTQKPDPSVLPTREQYNAAVRRGVEDYLARFGFGKN